MSTIHAASAATVLAILCFAGCEKPAMTRTATQPATQVEPESHPFQVRLVIETPDAQKSAQPYPDPHPAPGGPTVVHVDRTILLHEGHIDFARPTKDAEGRRVVAVRFTEEGATLMRQVTRQHTGERIALILDGKVVMAPRIQTEIGADAILDGGGDGFTEAEQLKALQLLNVSARSRASTSGPATRSVRSS